MSEAIRKMFDEISPRYDILNRVLSARRDVAWRKRSVRKLPTKPLDILDLCGGTGDFLMEAQSAGRFRSGVVADFSGGMLSHVAKKASLSAIQADALNLPFADQSFDACLCGFGMRNLDNLEAGVQSVHRVLRPGGTFVTLEFFRPEMVVPRFFYNVLAPLAIPAVGKLFGSRKEAYEYLVRSTQRFARVEDYGLMLEKNGFAKVEILANDFGISHLVVAQKR
jgi:demethylmenaquinone methyltransferase / 2-methoxy-6-polyprenyl-1,4-benzoquinol methylase